MLRELLGILREHDPLQEVGERFREMLTLTQEMALSAGDIAFGVDTSPASKSLIYERDRQVNHLERTIRKWIVAHLSLSDVKVDVPYCLLLIGLVKDVERIGDYAKNLLEIADIHAGPLPEDEIVAELREIRAGVEATFRSTAGIFLSSDQEQALRLLRQGRETAQRCDALIGRIGRAGYGGETTTALVLATRYYKRIGGHVLNVLSSVVMPLHKVDYYDERVLATGDPDAAS